jgi:glutamate synthase (NADPH/NADH) large chain
MVAHNGEINTVGQLQLDARPRRRDEIAVLGDDLQKLFPLIYEGQSDTATSTTPGTADHGGYPLAQAMMMMIPKPGKSTPDGRAAAPSTNTTPR